tara:strand:- start:3115 stop:3516 length:402 start_codon:yes stop_codon:yes gene_type:complete
MRTVTSQPDESVIFDRLIAERGGSTTGWTVIQLAAAQALAQRLSRRTSDPKDIAPLEALLPHPRGPSAFDLARLSDEELGQLERLLLKASGGAEPAPVPVDRDEKIGQLGCRIDHIEVELQESSPHQASESSA